MNNIIYETYNLNRDGDELIDHIIMVDQDECRKPQDAA